MQIRQDRRLRPLVNPGPRLSAKSRPTCALARSGILGALAMSVAEPVSAADSIPETPGWGGFVIAAFGFASLRGNTMAGNRTFDVSCLFRPGGGGNHQVRPRARYTVDNRDGDAVAGDSIWLQLTHGYSTPGDWVISNIAYGRADRDARSPIFGVKTDPDRYVLGTTLFVRLNAPGPVGRVRAACPGARRIPA